MKRFTRFKELLILGVLCLAPLFVARQAAAQILDSIYIMPCDGYMIGSFCEFVFPDDPTLCQDCAEQNCIISCLGDLYGEKYCFDVSFTTCIGGLIVKPFWEVDFKGSGCGG